MSGYGAELLRIATHYGIPMVMTPAADHDRLCRRTADALGIVEQCIPPDDRLHLDVADRLSLLRGLVCQATGFEDHDGVAYAHELERLVAKLEHRSLCEDRADAVREVLRVDHRLDRETVPTVLAFPFTVLMRETVHAEELHLPRLRANIRHCPSLLPELQAIEELEGALPAALQVLVGDNPQKAAEWILWGRNAV